jgi:hypothetical protein
MADSIGLMGDCEGGRWGRCAMKFGEVVHNNAQFGGGAAGPGEARIFLASFGKRAKPAEVNWGGVSFP